MADRRKGNMVRGQFGKRRTMAELNRRAAGDYVGHVKPKLGSTDWLDPEAYNALSREQKFMLAARRHQKRIQSRARGRRHHRRSFGGYFRYRGMIAVAAFAAIFIVGRFSEAGLSLPNLHSKSTPVSASFGYCHVGGGFNCVVDGDTFWLNGVDIRIANIDAPETHDYRCSEELALGNRATNRLHELLESGSIRLQPIDRDEDVYGRKLRLVYVNGTNVGEALIDEGLAHRYVRGKTPWC